MTSDSSLLSLSRTWVTIVGCILPFSPVPLVVIAFACAAPAFAQEEKQAESQAVNYGKTPDTVIPFRDFKEPYNRFFQTVMPFRGSGRDEEPATLCDTVRIGFMGPVGSAPDSDLGEQMLQGIQLALEEANAAGGYQGIPFELIIRPDLGLWGATSNEMAAFTYEDDVLAVIGSIDGANTHIALRVALKTKTVLVNTGDTDPTLTETNLPWVIRCIADDRQQGYALAHHIFNECGIERVVAFRVNDRYGRVGIAEFRDAARRLKHPLRVELRWERGDRDFTLQLDRIAETRPEAIVLWGNASDTAAVVREIRRRGIRAPSASAGSAPAPVRIFGCDRLVSRTFIAEAGEAAEGVVAVATYDPTRDDPCLKAFAKAFSGRFNHEPEAYAAHAYDGANILIAAIRKAGFNRVRIRDALFEYTHYDGVTGPVDFDTTLNDIGPVYIATVEKGRFVYREARFARAAGFSPRGVSTPGGVAKRSPPEPYRTLAQSPPMARSPARLARGAPTAYRVGCFLPLDAAGRAAVRGVEMALADDASRRPDETPIELLVRDARGAWGDDSASLVDLVFTEEVVALIGSTERRGTHLAEMIAAKFHFPIVTLCGSDATITGIPLPWVFCIAPAGARMDPEFARRYLERYGLKADVYAALGYDAGALVADRIKAGAQSRLALRDALAAVGWNWGVSGTFRFDNLGNRIDYPAERSHGSGAIMGLEGP